METPLTNDPLSKGKPQIEAEAQGGREGLKGVRDQLEVGSQTPQVLIHMTVWKKDHTPMTLFLGKE